MASRQVQLPGTTSVSTGSATSASGRRHADAEARAADHVAAVGRGDDHPVAFAAGQGVRHREDLAGPVTSSRPAPS